MHHKATLSSFAWLNGWEGILSITYILFWWVKCKYNSNPDEFRNIYGQYHTISLISEYHFHIQLQILLLNVINSLGPSDAILWHKTGTRLAQVMACCLTAPSHYLNQFDLSSVRSSDILLSECNFTVGISAINHCNRLEKNQLKLH